LYGFKNCKNQAITAILPLVHGYKIITITYAAYIAHRRSPKLKTAITKRDEMKDVKAGTLIVLL
jgi:hypothetical protein